MGYLVLDVETTKLPNIHPWSKNSYLCSVGVLRQSGEIKTWILNHVSESTRPHNIMLAEIQAELDACDYLVAHNAKFDLQWLMHAGLDVSNVPIKCTEHAEYLLRGQDKSLSYSLNACAARYGIEQKLDMMAKFWEQGIETDAIPLHIHIPYLEQDLRVTQRLWECEQPYLKQAGLDKLATLMFKNMKHIASMELYGFLLDRKQAEEYVAQYDERVKAYDKRMFELLGREFSLESTDQLRAALFGGTVKETYVEMYTKVLKSGLEKLCHRKATREVYLPGMGFTPPAGQVSRKTGKPSTDKDTLSLLHGDTPEQEEFIELLRLRRAEGKTLQTLVAKKEDGGLLNKIALDGRVHPSFNMNVTATARLSSSNPNGQNFPRSGTSPIKKLIVSSLGCLLNGDLSQIEWRIAAALCGDETMIRELIDGLDIHTDNAIRFFGAGKFDRHSKEFKKLRNAAKTLAFRLLYGGSAAGFHRDQRMPRIGLEAWKKVVADFYAKYPGLKEWQNKNYEYVQRNGFLRNPSGRVLTFGTEYDYDGVLVPQRRAICNYPVQSASADLIFLAMDTVITEIGKRGLNARLILSVHDSLVFDVQKEHAAELAQIIMDVYNNLGYLAQHHFGWDIRVPLTGEIEVGYSYGVVKAVEDIATDLADVDAFLTAA